MWTITMTSDRFFTQVTNPIFLEFKALTLSLLLLLLLMYTSQPQKLCKDTVTKNPSQCLWHILIPLTSQNELKVFFLSERHGERFMKKTLSAQKLPRFSTLQYLVQFCLAKNRVGVCVSLQTAEIAITVNTTTNLSLPKICTVSFRNWLTGLWAKGC